VKDGIATACSSSQHSMLCTNTIYC
jgi:hypothetical protein